MSSKFTEEELRAFLDYAVDKGLMNTATARSRKIAAGKVLSALGEEEKSDLRSVDRDLAFHRFVNKFGKGFTPASLKTYRSRFQVALDDFIRYTENPAAFRPTTTTREKRADEGVPTPAVAKKILIRPRLRALPTAPATTQTPVPSHAVVFPVPIRDDVTVRIFDLPRDLTMTEAEKISAVVKALASPVSNPGAK